MNNTNIELSSLTPVGAIENELRGGELIMTTTRAIHDAGYNIRRDKINSYMLLPGRYRLPMRIDLSLLCDSPEMLVLIGDGHVSFGSPWMENRRIEDIAEPNGKPRIYDNSIVFGEYADISIIYNHREVQILINGEERYYSAKERYMKAKSFAEKNTRGFEIALTCTKRTDLRVRSISIYEGETEIPTKRDAAPISEPKPENPAPAQKHSFDSCINGLPDEIKTEIVKTESLLKSLPNLRFKRIIEKHGNKITYVESSKGVSYALYLSGNIMYHSVQWYIVTNGPVESWRRKANPLESLLEWISDESPELARRIFRNLNECIGCRERCLAKTPYSYLSQKKLSCHGHIMFKMLPSEFQDVRDLFTALNQFTDN